MDISLTEDLERLLTQEELPGVASQLLMAPEERQNEVEPKGEYKKACVLVLLYPKDDEWHVALIQRTSKNVNDKHAGQISLPGGKLEDSDESYEYCALREAEEEIGISKDQIGILGELSKLYVPVSKFMIYPFVGFTTEEPDFVPQQSEVEDVIEVRLKKLFKNKKHGKVNVRNSSFEVPYYEVQKHKVWGATAMILSEFETILSNVG